MKPISVSFLLITCLSILFFLSASDINKLQKQLKIIKEEPFSCEHTEGKITYKGHLHGISNNFFNDGKIATLIECLKDEPQVILEIKE